MEKQVEIMGRKTTAKVVKLKKATGTKNCYFCPECGRIMYNFHDIFRCHIHGNFVKEEWNE